LQSYCLATVRQNQPTAALLYELITNFMKAYSNPETMPMRSKLLTTSRTCQK